MSKLDRFTRHRALLGDAGLERLSQATVAVCGAGGLGSTLLTLIARLGVGKIHIYDPGTFDTPDLNRQTLYTANDIGKEKALRAAELLSAIGPEVSVTPHVERAGAQTDFSYADLVVDCLDTFTARFLIDDATYEAGVPLIHAGVYKYFGQITSVRKGRTRPLRELFSQSAAAMDAEPGKPMYPPAVATVAAFEASECVRVLLGEEEKTLFGRLLSVDLDSLEVTVLPFC